MKKLFLTAIALCMSVALFAQDTFLWKVSGNGLTKDSYVFGTLHMACGQDFKIENKVNEALKTTDRIAFEIDAENPETLKAMQANMGPVPGFFDGLAPEKKKVIDSVLMTRNLNSAMLDKVGPAMLLSILSIQGFECANPTDFKMMELELKKLEGAAGKPVDELETVEFQINMMNEFFKAEDLYNYVLQIDSVKSQTKHLVQAYFGQKPAALEEWLAKTSTMTPEKEAMMLTNRNKEWMTKMPDMMKNNSMFFAVGAAHLMGKNGILQLLKDKGYTLTPILN
ncbi:TraB/GumN family protein [Sphingobacterium lactis]|uniref:TraB/GumN family protein n=1 Tax=Sphingobacterium lactis TaxID=797291 RepID=UPI003DA42B3A